MSSKVDRRARSSVGLNLAANFASLGFLMASALVAMPLYLRALGLEAYGLIGFYAVLTAGFQVLDVGLSQTLARECARYRSGALDGPSLRRTAVTFEAVFGALALIGAVVIVTGASTLASHWLRIDRLPLRDVVLAISLMGLAVPAQWMSGLYRGALNGLEHQVSLATFNIGVTAVRYFGVLGAMNVLGARPSVYFGYQAGLAVFELGLLALAVRVLLPRSNQTTNAGRERLDTTRLVRFSAAIALATVAWMVQLQGDKAILSKVLPLGAFGVFTLAATATGAVVNIAGPIGQALLPRLTRLIAEDDASAALVLYRGATQLACVIAMTPAMLLMFFAEPILLAWTRDGAVAHAAAPILRAYALGSGLLPVAAFPYYLQYAYGRLRLHVVWQLVLLPLLLIGLVVASIGYGAVGTGVVWTVAIASCVAIYAPIVHHRFAPRLNQEWLLQDIAPIAGAIILTTGLLSRAIDVSPDRVVAVGQIAFVGAIVLIVGIAFSSPGRSRVRTVWRQLASSWAA